MRRQALQYRKHAIPVPPHPQDMEGEKREYRKENLNEGE